MASKPAALNNDERSKLIEKESVEVGKVSVEIIGKGNILVLVKVDVRNDLLVVPHHALNL